MRSRWFRREGELNNQGSCATFSSIRELEEHQLHGDSLGVNSLGDNIGMLRIDELGSTPSGIDPTEMGLGCLAGTSTVGNAGVSTFAT